MPPRTVSETGALRTFSKKERGLIAAPFIYIGLICVPELHQLARIGFLGGIIFCGGVDFVFILLGIAARRSGGRRRTRAAPGQSRRAGSRRGCRTRTGAPPGCSPRRGRHRPQPVKTCYENTKNNTLSDHHRSWFTCKETMSWSRFYAYLSMIHF